MTQFSFASENVRRLRREDPGGFGIVESLTAPGLVPEPPVSAAETQLAQLGEALGVIGSAAGAVGSIAANRLAQREQDARDTAKRRAEFARQQELKSRNQEYLDNVVRGSGRRAAREALPGIGDDILNRRIIVPDGETPQSVMEALLTQRFGEDPVYADAAREQIGPQIVAALTAQKQAERDQARSENIRALSDQLGASADDPAAIVAQARAAHPEISDGELFDKLIKPAAIAAADRGDPDRAGAIVDAAGEGFTTEREGVVRRAEAFRSDAQSRARAAARDSIDGVITDGDLNTAEERIHAERKAGSLDEGDAAVLLNRVRAERARSTIDNSKLVENQLKETWRAENVARWTETLLAAETTGGRIALPREDVKLTLPDGAVLDTITPKEAFDLSLSSGMARIADRFADDPDQSFAQQAALLTANAAEWQPWKDLLAQGAAFMPIAVRRIRDGGEAPPLPATAVAGFELHKRLANLSPGLLTAHEPDPGTRLFYEMAEIAESEDARFRVGPVQGPNPEAALISATKAVSFGAAGSISRDALSKAVEDNATIGNWRDGGAWIIPWDESKIDNLQDIRGLISGKAEYLIRTGATSSYDAAVKQAVKSVKRSHTRLNGYLVETPTGLNRGTLSNVTEHLAERYATEFGEEEGVQARDITLVPVRGRQGLWQLLRKDGATLAPLNKSFSFLESNFVTDRQILDLAAEAAASAAKRNTPRGFGDITIIAPPGAVSR